MKHTPLSLLFVSLVAAVPVMQVACGTSGDDLFGKGSASGSGGATSSATSSATTSSSTSDTSSSSGARGGGGSTSEASSASATASSASASSTGSGPGGMLDCGGQSCPQGGQAACCWDHFMLNGAPQGECVQGSPENDGCETGLVDGPSGAETRIECETPDQCAGKMCCGKKVSSNIGQYYTEVSCQPICDWPDVLLCDMLDPTFICPIVDNNGFPTQTICKASMLLPTGYFVCGLP